MKFNTSDTVEIVKLGQFIERSTVNNKDLKYGIDLIEGVTSDGVFSIPKGNPIDVDLKPYKIVHNGAFVYNPSRLNLGSIAYRTDGMCIVSHLYIIFYLNEEGERRIDPEWLYMYFRREEFYREVTFRNFGSQRPEFNFNDMSELMIPLPDIDIQKKYVNVYKAMVANQQSYERGLDDLKQLCDLYIENLRRSTDLKQLGSYLIECDQRNIDNISTEYVRGLSTNKEMIPTKANMRGVNVSNYKVVKPGQIAYVSDTSRRGDKISIGFNDTGETFLVSSISTVFETKTERLLPKYLMLFLTRTEFDRYARFHSWGSARETFDWEEMCEVEIPIPNITVQKAIVDIYDVYITRKRINEKLKEQIKDIYPVLIRGSLQDGGESCG